MQEVEIEKLVHGGQGLGTLPDGKKVFVWNALPGEKVAVRIIKNKKDYAEAIAEEIITPSADRIKPLEPNSYLATSPWQIMTFEAENNFKKVILTETFAREGIDLMVFDFISSIDRPGRAAGAKTAFFAPRDEKPETGVSSRVENPSGVFHYRSKMEWGFWGDDDGIHLAHFVRGSHGKVITSGSVLAQNQINMAVSSLIKELNSHKNLRAGDLKSVIVRCCSGKTVTALFVKRRDFIKLKKPEELSGLVVYYSNPKSPASVPTELLYEMGERSLSDKVLNTQITYDILSFFQVNLEVFEKAVMAIDSALKDLPKIDLYSGVGSIGIPIKGTTALVESELSNIKMAEMNIGKKQIEIVHAQSEKVLDYITGREAVIVDPPRAGLHEKVVEKLIDAKPPKIAYLSCNPVTQARDIKYLLSGYKITFVAGYNFFPRTPHIESLVILERKK